MTKPVRVVLAVTLFLVALIVHATFIDVDSEWGYLCGYCDSVYPKAGSRTLAFSLGGIAVPVALCGVAVMVLVGGRKPEQKP